MKNINDVSTGRILVMMGSFAIGGAFKGIIDGHFFPTIFGAVLAGSLYMIGFKKIQGGCE
ncbi:Protein of unknown function [Bacillus cereus]|nr:Protein of unknown function [Bacillus cereus]